jgi:hypothetical protein
VACCRVNFTFTFTFSHVVAFDCGMFVVDLCILFVLMAWFVYFVVTCALLCNATLWMQIDTNTTLKTKKLNGVRFSTLSKFNLYT